MNSHHQRGGGGDFRDDDPTIIVSAKHTVREAVEDIDAKTDRLQKMVAELETQIQTAREEVEKIRTRADQHITVQTNKDKIEEKAVFNGFKELEIYFDLVDMAEIEEDKQTSKHNLFKASEMLPQFLRAKNIEDYKKWRLPDGSYHPDVKDKRVLLSTQSEYPPKEVLIKMKSTTDKRLVESQLLVEELFDAFLAKIATYNSNTNVVDMTVGDEKHMLDRLRILRHNIERTLDVIFWQNVIVFNKKVYSIQSRKILSSEDLSKRLPVEWKHLYDLEGKKELFEKQIAIQENKKEDLEKRKRDAEDESSSRSSSSTRSTSRDDSIGSGMSGRYDFGRHTVTPTKRTTERFLMVGGGPYDYYGYSSRYRDPYYRGYDPYDSYSSYKKQPLLFYVDIELVVRKLHDNIDDYRHTLKEESNGIFAVYNLYEKLTKPDCDTRTHEFKTLLGIVQRKIKEDQEAGNGIVVRMAKAIRNAIGVDEFNGYGNEAESLIPRNYLREYIREREKEPLFKEGEIIYAHVMGRESGKKRAFKVLRSYTYTRSYRKALWIKEREERDRKKKEKDAAAKAARKRRIDSRRRGRTRIFDGGRKTRRKKSSYAREEDPSPPRIPRRLGPNNPR